MPAKKNSTINTIQNNIKKIMKELDEQSLIFLLEQAQILKHNMEVDKINKEIIESRKNSEKVTTTSKISTESLSIKIIADNDGKNFILNINNKRKFLTRDEFKKIVEICYNGNETNLFNWLQRERKDILIDAGIKSKSSQYLSTIINLIKSKYKLKQ